MDRLPRSTRGDPKRPEPKTAWLRTALIDAAKRAGSAFKLEAQVHSDWSITETLMQWAIDHQLQQIAAMRPEIGPLYDQLRDLQAALTQVGMDLVLFDRSEDLALRPLATGGFFGFWEKIW